MSVPYKIERVERDKEYNFLIFITAFPDSECRIHFWAEMDKNMQPITMPKKKPGIKEFIDSQKIRILLWKG